MKHHGGGSHQSTHARPDAKMGVLHAPPGPRVRFNGDYRYVVGVTSAMRKAIKRSAAKKRRQRDQLR